MISYSIYNDIKNRKVAFIATILLVILGIELGLWQLRRAEYKEQLAVSVNEKKNEKPIAASDKKWSIDEAKYRPMIADGVWLNDEAIWLDNRPHPKGRDPKTGITTGLIFLMPLKIRIHEEEYILWVNRGWVPRNFSKRDEVPKLPTPSEKIQLLGIVMPDAGKTIELGVEENFKASDGHALKQNFLLEKESAKLNLPFLPFVLRQAENDNQDGLDRNWQSEDFGVSKHKAYAFQWFSLAIMTLIFWVITGIRKQRKRLG